MSIILRWGFAIVIPYFSFEGGFHIETFTLLRIENISPIGAFLITLFFTLLFGWFQGWLIVKSGISSFIVTLGGLFFLRGLTETIYRAFNKAADQSAGSTTVTDLPDFKNIINVPGQGEMERVDAKSLPAEDLLFIIKDVSSNTLDKIRENLTYINEKVAATKTIIQQEKMTASLLKTLETLKAQGKEDMATQIQEKIDSGAAINVIQPQPVTEIDIARA